MLASVVSAIAASAPRSRWNRFTSSAAMCWASAALPPLPKMSSLPPCSCAVRMRRAASTTGARLACATRWCTAIVASKIARTRLSASVPISGQASSARSQLRAVARLLDVRDELFFRYLQRFVRLHRLLDLHGIILAHRMPLPVLGHQEPPQVRVPFHANAIHVPELAFG